MCGLPQSDAQCGLRFHGTDPRPAMRLPMKSFLFLAIVISLWILGCSHADPKTIAMLNQEASLGGQLPANPLQWKVITSMIDRTASTMSTLYGNDTAIRYVRTHSQ